MPKPTKKDIAKYRRNEVYEALIAERRQATPLQRHVDDNGFVYYKAIENNDNTIVDKKE